MGNYVYTKSRIWKNFEAAGRIDWKSKKKDYASTDVLCVGLPLKTGEDLVYWYLVAYLSSYHEKAINALAPIRARL